MSNYILGSHNSWSYLPPKKWWTKPFAFIAKCQRIDIKRQYELGVRCFDLRVKFERGVPTIAHGCMTYKYNMTQLYEDLSYLNSCGDCVIRILHEVRNKKDYTDYNVVCFKQFCTNLCKLFPNIKFWCGRNLYNWKVDCDFYYKPTCEEKYSSVQPPKWIDDWWPFIYAKLHNKKIKETGTTLDILLIDFVDV